jgi:hypothetical protein
MASRRRFGDADGLREGPDEWLWCVALPFVFTNRAHLHGSCLDRDYDPALFEHAFPLNDSACFSIALTNGSLLSTKPRIYTLKGDRGSVEARRSFLVLERSRLVGLIS